MYRGREKNKRVPDASNFAVKTVHTVVSGSEVARVKLPISAQQRDALNRNPRCNSELIKAG